MAEHNELGKLGERMALAYLQEKGYTILATGYRYRRAEVDIIARKDDWVIIVEVKTRTNRFFGRPEEFVSPAKIKQIVKASDHFIKEAEIDAEIRFDIISIILNSKEESIEHIEDAFYYFQ